MTHLVFGGDGFVGRALVTALKTETGAAVLAPRADECDLRDEAALRRVVASVAPDCIYHLVGASRVSNTIPMPIYFESNFLTTANLALVLASTAKATRVLFTSTMHVYGNREETVTEDSAPRPQSDYAFTKYLGEEALRRFGAAEHHTVVVARLYTCLGPGQPPGFVAADLSARIAALPKTGKAVLKTGPLDGSRRFLDVRDAAALFPRLLAAMPSGPRLEIVNVASPHEVTIADMVQRLLRLAGKKATIESEKRSDNAFRGLKVDLAKLHRLVPDARFRDLDQTLAEML